ncbi:MAG: flagellar hook assembly protein FlgD [Desulfobulbaceae bacterium]|nr:flagellar hook assembly protein FlgD [Desulfobulbaceae bacterium]
MAVSGISSNSAGLVQPEGVVGKKDLKTDDFLKLFITQLQYQDPMKPMDSYEMASQLAQFSNMEATSKMSDNMEKLLDYQTSQNNLQLMSLLGNQVQVVGNAMGVIDGKASATDFIMNDVPRGTMKVTILNEANQPVSQQDIASHGAGNYEIEWDGMDSNGKPVEDGLYHYEVKAYNLAGEELAVEYRSTGKVTDIRYENNAATLTLDGQIVAGVGAVVKVK